MKECSWLDGRCNKGYDAIIISRLDIILRSAITHWNCSLAERPNFASRCDARQFADCVNDVLLTIPASELPALYRGVGAHPAEAECRAAVGHDAVCFDHWRVPQRQCDLGPWHFSGHGCGTRLAFRSAPGYCWPRPDVTLLQNVHPSFTFLRVDDRTRSNQRRSARSRCGVVWR